jgi:FkbM family methyltransferase
MRHRATNHVLDDDDDDNSAHENVRRNTYGTKMSKSAKMYIVLLVVVGMWGIQIGLIPSSIKSSETAANAKYETTKTNIQNEYVPSELCTSLPNVNPWQKLQIKNPKCNDVVSKEGLDPKFHFGSFFPANRVKFHMADDFAHFQLIKEQIQKKTVSIAFDIGANQGFFTFWVAALGVDVHAFEINAQNFEALQHGVLYNADDVSKHVHLYNMGVTNKDARMGMKGGGYDGFLREDPDGDILALTVDCFRYHRPELFDTAISFVKIDVEGFEIAVLEGMKHSILSPSQNVGSLIIEVGPNRWSRAGVSIERGISEMTELSTHFKNANVIFREKDTCPGKEMLSILSIKEPERELHGKKLYKMAAGDWMPLLTLMNDRGFDCNFWFTNE